MIGGGADSTGGMDEEAAIASDGVLLFVRPRAGRPVMGAIDLTHPDSAEEGDDS